MGIIIGKFRKKKSTYEILEKLEKEIISIEEFSRSTEQFRKKVITRFILLAVVIYFILACLLYLYYHKISPNRKLVYIVPLVAFPFIIFFIKKFLAWYYSRKLQRNERKLVKLKEEKSKIINNVMETETYKVAKQILDKFGNESQKPGTEITLASNLIARNNQTGLRQRNVQSRLSVNSVNTPITTIKSNFVRTPLQASVFPATRSVLPTTPQLPQAQTATPLPLPRRILPNNRSVLDKMVEYLVGDGPSNRYALICKKCSSHNGMALKEEFEYLSFRCCYCSQFNSARKKKATGPMFEAEPKKLLATDEDSTDSDKDTQDSDSEEIRSSPKQKQSPEREKVLDSEVETVPEETPVEKSSENRMEVDQPTAVSESSGTHEED